MVSQRTTPPSEGNVTGVDAVAREEAEDGGVGPQPETFTAASRTTEGPLTWAPDRQDLQPLSSEVPKGRTRILHHRSERSNSPPILQMVKVRPQTQESLATIS